MEKCRLASFSLNRTEVSVQHARRIVRALVGNWFVRLDNDTGFRIELVTSELVANAVRHGAGAMLTIALDVVSRPRRVRVEVHDGSTVLPEPSTAGPDAESGRGLLLVASMSYGHGAEGTEQGKGVWAELVLPG